MKRKCKIERVVGDDVLGRAEAIIEAYSAEFELTHFQCIPETEFDWVAVVMVFQQKVTSEA